MGIKWKKILKVVAIVAAVVAVAWIAAPLLGSFGAAIQSGITAIGEAIGGAFAAAGEALGISGAATAAEGAGAAAAAAEGAATAGGVLETAAAGAAEAAGGAAAAGGAGSAAGEAALLTLPEGSAAATSGLGVSAGEAAAINAPLNIGASEIAASAVPSAVTNTASTGMLGQIGAWVKDNPLVASTLLKGAGDFAGSLAQKDEWESRMEYEDWLQQRASDSTVGALKNSNLQYTNAGPNVLRRLDGTPVFTGSGGVPGGALQRVLPGYGMTQQPKPPGG